jgi:hypothetical protein
MVTSFEDDCRALCDDLTEYAERSRPEWTAHPDRRKSISARRFELFKEFRRAGDKVLRYQYVFGPTTILVGIYLTMLGDEAQATCDKLDAAKVAIEQQCGARTSWDRNRKQERIRFRVLAHSTRVELVKHGADERLIRDLVDLMRRFQRATLPIVGFRDLRDGRGLRPHL